MATPLRAPAEQPDTVKQDLPVIALLRNLVNETTDLLRTEVDVLKLELQESTRAMIRDSIKAIVYSGIAMLGILSLMAFLIIALGDLISGSGTNVTGFWVSALIIGLIFTIFGGLMALHYGKRIGSDVTLAKARHELCTDREFVRDEYQKFKDAARP